MLSIQSLTEQEANQFWRACGYIFSAERVKDQAFLHSLNFDMIKLAFREKIKRYHPDLHGHEVPQILEKRKERFVRIMESFETLKKYFPETVPSPPARSFGKPTIIAVGGAKGGIGKSIFSANLGIYLARKGRQTVLVDLDLGGANLHLYLGETRLPLTINDFLTQRTGSIEDVLIPTRYGPKLIGGDSSRLGAANIDFSLKRKLMKSLRLIDADYIILDLGGDTSYNIIDFFLAADCGIVMTTCDPSSYLDAYNFIKVSLFRKLNRMFGPEASPRPEKDPVFQKLIAEATTSKNGRRVTTISQLLSRIKEEQPGYLGRVNTLLEAYRPLLVINMAEADANTTDVAQRITEVSRKMLSVQVEYLGAFPYQDEIKRSARELVPAVVKFPEKKYWGLMDSILDRSDRVFE